MSFLDWIFAIPAIIAVVFDMIPTWGWFMFSLLCFIFLIRMEIRDILEEEIQHHLNEYHQE